MEISQLFAQGATTRRTDNAVIKCEPVAVCNGCEAVFVQPRYKNARSCSNECKNHAKRRDSIISKWRQCQQCYNLFVANERTDPGKFCSRSCTGSYKTASTPLIVKAMQTCPVCEVEFDGRARKYCSYACSYKVHSLVPTTSKVCGGCGTTYVGTSNMVYCTQLCARRTIRASRKAHKRSVTVESFNPVVVLERDGWQCYLCGVSTPRELRGTYNDNAPELEHIIALANGGEHSMTNTACACRKCNGLKAANDNYVATRVAA